MSVKKITTIWVVWLFCIYIIPCQSNEDKKIDISTVKVGDKISGIAYKVDNGKAFHLVRIDNL
jgi:lipoate-protein ligase A